ARIASLFANINIVEKRWAETEINGTTIIRQLAKGQVGVACSRAFAYLAALPGRKAMTLNVDGRYYTEHDVENTCWAYDADYEFLANSGIEQIAVGGARRYDQMLRLLIAGVPATAIVSSAAERETADLLSLKGIDTVANVYDDDNIVVVGWAVQDRLIARLQAESSAELGGDNAH
ncbi:MAG: DUF1727 domain-containing protein, partial [Propionibacteriaceae bacterium]|nr:DUF1727 domain-containing protein [Propionibacteriaceae bacterium]